MDNDITLKRTDSDNKDFAQLIRQLDKDLYNRYESVQAAYDAYNKIESIDTVIIAYHNNQPVGCGCFKTYSRDAVEMKRMFVGENFRGKGISKKILKALEVWASELGFSRAILETGTKQQEAIGLYQKSGYKQIENYGQYKDMIFSICYEKEI